MKKWILLICLLYLISGCSAKNSEKENETLETLKLNVIKKDNCENEISEYYEYNNRKIYFVCLNEVKLVEKPQTLSYYFNQASNSFEDKIKAIKTNLKESIATIMFSNLDISKKRIEIRKLKRKGLSDIFVRMFIKLLEYVSEI